jgi:hypothetical protein
MTHPVEGSSMGINYEQIDTVQQFALGTPSLGNDNHLYTYVQANGAIAGAQTDIAVTTAFQASDGAGTNVGPTAAVADNEYCWVHNATIIVDNG